MPTKFYYNNEPGGGTTATNYKTVSAAESGCFLFDPATNRYWIFYVKEITGPPITYNLCETHNDKFGVHATTDWSTEATLVTGIENCILDAVVEIITNTIMVTYVKKNGANYDLYTSTSSPVQNYGLTWVQVLKVASIT